MAQRPLDVVLFGETGSGKSSVVNLLAGKQVAQTSPDVDGCTTSCQPYSIVSGLDGISYTIWDTVGLDGWMSGDEQRVIDKMHGLVKDLNKTGGVNLFLFCHRQGRITTLTKEAYALLQEVARQKSVPIAVVITHLEQENRMEDWWEQNAEIFEQRGIHFCGHACVTTLLEHPMAQESKEAIERLVCALRNRQDGR